MKSIFVLFLVVVPSFSIVFDHSGSSDSGSHEHSHEHNHPRPPPRPPAPAPPAPGPPPGSNANRPTCPQHWFTSYRPQGIWCLRVGLGKMDYNGAIAECATYGGVLSGVQNDWERWLIAQEANRQALYYNLQYSGVWLGAQRSSVDNTFHWTDGHTTGTAMFKFGPGQPDNKPGLGPQNCVQMIALTPGYWNHPGQWAAFQNGDLDDYWCNQNTEPATRMYACGMRGPPE